MSIKSFQYSFSAAETKTFRGGDYFTIEELSDEVDVELFDNTGNSLGLIENIGAGFWIKLPKDKHGDPLISRIDITSATAQTVNVIAGFGEFGVNKTSTNITGGVLDPRTLVTHNSHLVTNSSTTIITPAANTNGVRIDNINLQNFSVSNTTMVILTKTSAPTGINDTSARALFLARNATGYEQVDKAIFPIIVPAGEGVYSFAGALSSGYISTEYEVL